MARGHRLARAHRDEIEALAAARAATRARIVAELGLEALARAVALLDAQRGLVRRAARHATARGRAAGAGHEQPRAVTAALLGITAERKAALMQRAGRAPERFGRRERPHCRGHRLRGGQRAFE